MLQFSFPKVFFILTTYLLQDSLERVFGKIKWLAGSARSFGALSFKRLLRNFILGCGEVIPQPKKTNVLPGEPENDITGFEEATEDLVRPVKSKGKVIVSLVLEVEDEIMDISDEEIIHFESNETEDPELESQYFESCGMSDDVKHMSRNLPIIQLIGLS